MLKKNMGGLDAIKLRILLVVSILLIILIGAGAFYFIRQKMVTYAQEVSRISAQASSSNQNLVTLKSLQGILAENRATIERTKSIVADSKSYQYQDQIISDLNTYATRAGVGISGYSFTSAADAAAAAPAAAATPAAPAAGATGTVTPPAAAATATPKSSTVSVTLKGSVPYPNIVNFIHSIEQNLTKMQLSGISLAKDPQSSNVTSNALTIEVYVR